MISSPPQWHLAGDTWEASLPDRNGTASSAFCHQSLLPHRDTAKWSLPVSYQRAGEKSWYYITDFCFAVSLFASCAHMIRVHCRRRELSVWFNRQIYTDSTRKIKNLLIKILLSSAEGIHLLFWKASACDGCSLPFTMVKRGRARHKRERKGVTVQDYIRQNQKQDTEHLPPSSGWGKKPDVALLAPTSLRPSCGSQLHRCFFLPTLKQPVRSTAEHVSSDTS